jgi:hypothetical protein
MLLAQFFETAFVQETGKIQKIQVGWLLVHCSFALA